MTPRTPRPPLRAPLPGLLLALAGCMLAGCMNVSPPGLMVASDPPGARVHIDGQDTGWVTPCQIALDVEEPHVLTVALLGHTPRELLLVPNERHFIIDWYQAVNGARSTIRFPLLMPTPDLLLPLREVRALAPGRVHLRLRPEGTQ